MTLSLLPTSYCANVHPGMSVAQVVSGLKKFTFELQNRRQEPIGLGLWLNRHVLAELGNSPAAREIFDQTIAEHDFAFYTLNGFPADHFHADRVKENVYLPDWSTPERRDYTIALAKELGRWLKTGVSGSISTAPLAFVSPKPDKPSFERFLRPLGDVAVALDQLRKETGKTVRLAIEPEPLCLLETTAETIAFFHELWAWSAKESIERQVREHLGVCFDVCHQAVEFEDVAGSIKQLAGEGIRINKVHLSSALELSDPRDLAAREELCRFVEPRYLHQTIAISEAGKRLTEFDLSREFIESAPADWLSAKSWRVHFHVPIHERKLGLLSTTGLALEQALGAVAELDYAPHLEVETYTWRILPTGVRLDEADLLSGLCLELDEAERLIHFAAGKEKIEGFSP